MKKIIICMAIVCAMFPRLVLAWGATGHRVIGEIAEKNLGKHAQQRLDQLLGHAGLAMVSNWGDFVRSDDHFAGTDKWHYKDMPAGMAHDEFCKQVVGQEDGEAVYRILQLVDTLKKNPGNVDGLKMLVHLVEDLHQPLHVGHPEDKGGNTVRLKWLGRDTNLHSLWDDGLIEFQKLSYTEYAAFLLRTNTFSQKRFAPSDVKEWAWETYQSTQKIYESVDQVSNPYKYNFLFVSLLESRLKTAGEHLAQILNYLYD
jgi:hypothetical protein